MLVRIVISLRLLPEWQRMQSIIVQSRQAGGRLKSRLKDLPDGRPRSPPARTAQRLAPTERRRRGKSLEPATAGFVAERERGPSGAVLTARLAARPRLARRLETSRRYAKGTHPAVDTSPRLPRDRRDYRFGSALPGSLPPVEPPAESAASGGGGNFRPSGCSPCSRTMVPSFAIA